MSRSRRLLVVLVTALLGASPVAVAGPLDPPEPDRWRVWRLERVDAMPRVMAERIWFTARTNRAMVFAVRFQDGPVRDFFDGQYTGTFAHPMGGAYPRATVGGREPVPCPAQVLCTEPEPWSETEYGFAITHGNVPTTLSAYVVAVNVDVVSFDLTSGWVLTELPAGSVDVHLVRNGTGVDTRATAGVDAFSSAGPVTTSRSSIAMAAIPCPWGLGGPMGPGWATLGGGGAPSWLGEAVRHPDCDVIDYGFAANDAPTSWTLDGESAGLMFWQFHLAVVELPAA